MSRESFTTEVDERAGGKRPADHPPVLEVVLPTTDAS